jgi:hypothetical protein
MLPGFDQEVPYLLVDVELVDQPGLRLTGRLLDGVDAALGLGTKVEVAFEHIDANFAVPAFRLAMP